MMYSRRIKLLITSLSISLITNFSFAQSASSSNAASLKLKIQKLNTLGSVLYFAAHPDDENTRLISWLANEKLYRTGYLSLTRGDGGQNLIGTEQAEELGLVRTQELLAARGDDGGEQFFSTANDFGFSKTFAETFKIWNKEKILADAVWVIRNFQPDVIITRFPGDPRAGHGHHQASSLIAQEAFKAAADPAKFPEQLKYVKPWQAKRILWNTYNFGSANTIKEGQFSVDIGQFNSLLGRTYGEIAAISRTNHKSQGFGSTPQRGEMYEYFETLAGSSPKHSLFDGIDTNWSRVPHAQHLQSQIQKINDSFNVEYPAHSVKDLIELLTALEKLGNSPWPLQKAKEVKELIFACAGIWTESQASIQKYALGETVDVNTNVVLQAKNISASLISLKANGGNEKFEKSLQLKYNQLERIKSSFVAHAITQPYWLAQPHSLGSFSVHNQTLIGKPEADDLPMITATFNIEGKIIDYEFPIVYSFNDPVRGEIKNPLVIAPPLTLNLHQKAIIFNGKNPKEMEVSFISNAEQTHATITPILPKGWRTEPAFFQVDLDHRNDEESKSITIYPAENATTNDSISFKVSYQTKNTEIAKSINTISYQHIPQITWFPPATAKLSKVETGISAKRIGYLSGAGDLVPQSLREIGLIVDVLSENDIMHKDLSIYDAIVTGIRIYNVNDRIRFIQPKLLSYVKNGGTLVEQYNVSGGLKTNQIGPYPFTISRDRVTDENAPVSIVDAQNSLLQFPNKITEKDFNGWIQERGLYFATDIDKAYVTPLAMNDPGETSNRGSLLIAKYGKGKYVYTSLAFFRELPAGVPGAYRLFVNLLAKENN
ncbi:PIG-L family deacetylase [Olivibacter domesticus]|uniref:N-acetylglucosaminyl deacetylase, LmbE family n=1 Tax=Olivibacter domesticus TaxID=407022 RepID=A0A1H7VTL2_OLID1|nr:PIG-L family deacetylase [Olivibacter domesticus]SEM12394.1 N-acetylglucosaminyl deacetylase, LmbE family [Olivibacter domesticus]